MLCVCVCVLVCTTTNPEHQPPAAPATNADINAENDVLQITARRWCVSVCALLHMCRNVSGEPRWSSGTSRPSRCRHADWAVPGSGICAGLPFVLPENGLFCPPVSAGHCEERFLVSALIHVVTRATMPPDSPRRLPAIQRLLWELRPHPPHTPVTAPRGRLANFAA